MRQMLKYYTLGIFSLLSFGQFTQAMAQNVDILPIWIKDHYHDLDVFPAAYHSSIPIFESASGERFLEASPLINMTEFIISEYYQNHNYKLNFIFRTKKMNSSANEILGISFKNLQINLTRQIVSFDIKMDLSRNG